MQSILILALAKKGNKMHKIVLDKIKVLDLINLLMPTDNGGSFTDAEIQWRYVLSQILKELHTGNYDEIEVIAHKETQTISKIEDGHIVDVEMENNESSSTI